MMSEEEQRVRTAYQESGHAVIAYLVGEKDRIVRITIRPDVAADAAGSIFFAPKLRRDNEEEIHRIIRIFAAGLHAEFLACQRHNKPGQEFWDPEATYTRTQSDREIIAWALEGLPITEDEADVVLGEHNDWVGKRIRKPQHWQAVEKLTAALLEKETLTGDEVRAIIEEALRK